MADDTLSQAYRTARRFAAEACDGNDACRALRLLARAAVVTLANDRPEEARDLIHNLGEELRVL